jgi:branched-subunit amino acid aminotransferase/4-amino-4-deoxychorismate lyase
MTRASFPAGTGIFETMRTEHGKIAELGRHMRRALSSAAHLGILLPDEETLRSELAKVISKEDFTIGRLRACFSKEDYSFSYLQYLEETEPAKLTFHSTTSEADGLQHKTYPYDSHFAVLDEARMYGFDDAIVFNSRNEITETSIANLALLIEGRWVTPPITAGVLPGVMRAVAIERCDIQVAPIHISDIARCDAALLLNSLKIARPVSHIGEYQLSALPEAHEKAAQIREKVEYFSVS